MILPILAVLLILALIIGNEVAYATAENAYPVACTLQVQKGKGSWVNVTHCPDSRMAMQLAVYIDQFKGQRVRVVVQDSPAVLWLS